MFVFKGEQLFVYFCHCGVLTGGRRHDWECIESRRNRQWKMEGGLEPPSDFDRFCWLRHRAGSWRIVRAAFAPWSCADANALAVFRDRSMAHNAG
jgi:hypothetical protein